MHILQSTVTDVELGPGIVLVLYQVLLGTQLMNGPVIVVENSLESVKKELAHVVQVFVMSDIKLNDDLELECLISDSLKQR